MKPIIINDRNKDRITAILDAIQGKCKARTIDYRDIAETCKRIENRLCIPKKCLEGSRFNVDIEAFNKPSAYKYTPYSTQFIVEFAKGNWKLIGIDRWETRREKHSILAELSETTKNAIIDHFSDMEY